jgi:DNA-binding NtrC family response regulator
LLALALQRVVRIEFVQRLMGMVAEDQKPGSGNTFGLVVSGEAGDFIDALRLIVGMPYLTTIPVRSGGEVLEVVRAGLADAVFLDEASIDIDALKLLRMIRRMNEVMLVVLLTTRRDRRWLEEALRLTAFSVVAKPLELEELLVQVHRMMVRLDQLIREQR